MDFRRIALFGLLLVTFVWALYTSPLTKGLFQKKRPAAPARVSAPLASPQAKAAPALEKAPPLSEDELGAWRQRYASAWSRDPFFTAEEEGALRAPKVAKAAPPAPPPPLPSYTVKAVLIAGSAKVATIDGRLISEGEMLGDERVVEIQPDGVILERAGLRRRVEIVGGTTPLIEVPGPERRSVDR